MAIPTAERNSGNLASDNVIHHRHMIVYREAAGLISGKVLEIGSGEGYGIRMISKYAEQYHAVDKYPTPIDKNLSNVFFKRSVVPPLTGFENDFFDFVLSFQVIEHIKDDVWFLQEIYRVLKPGGTMILTTPNILMSLTRNPWHIREYTPEQMKALLEKVFKTFEIKGVYGNEKVMKYYEENKKSVQKFTRWDFLKLQERLPRSLLKIPYDIANRLNRKKLHHANTRLVNDIQTSDFCIAEVSEACFDFFCIAVK